MTLYLRTLEGDTLLDVELNIATDEAAYVELHSVVLIEAYSKFLLNNSKRQEEIIQAFSELSELRGWLWEVYFVDGENDPKEFDNVKKELAKILQTVAEKFDLVLITD